MQKAIHIGIRIFENLSLFIFGRHCAGCGREGEDICRVCLSHLPVSLRTYDIKDTIACFDYQLPIVKRAVRNLKYSGKHALARVLGKLLYERMLEEYGDLKLYKNFIDPLIVPIPISAKRRRERGYNQSALLARAIVACDTEKLFSYANILEKVRETPHQADIANRKKRLKNVNNSFALKASADIRGRNIIVIDDVSTTGATIAEARRVLLAHGARMVIGFTLAH